MPPSGVLASAMMRNRAGSAPDLEGVTEAPKSPPRQTRKAVASESGTFSAFALQVSLKARSVTSPSAPANATTCAIIGIVSLPCPAGQLDHTIHAEALSAAANDRRVRSQRVGVTADGCGTAQLGDRAAEATADAAW